MREAGDLAAQLRACVKGEVRVDSVTKMLYRTDASLYAMDPVAVVIPEDAADVVQTVRVAAQHGVPILPRGGGTSLSGQAVGRAVVLDLSKCMNRILELDEGDAWVRVQPGVVLDELNAWLRPRGLMFGPDVATSSRANIGGMIGNNSSGARSLLYGKTIDHVLELTVVLADGSQVVCGPVDEQAYLAKAAQSDLEGQAYRQVRRIAADHRDEIERRFPKVMRRVSGYNLDEFTTPGRPFDLSKIIVGSEGTLGVVVEARLRLVELPRRSAVAACHFADLVEATRANLEILGTGPASVELVDKILLDLTRTSLEHARHRDFLQGDPQAVLFVEYYGDSEAELWEKMDCLEARLDERGMGYAVVTAFSPAEQRNMWELRKAGLGLLMSMKGDPKPLPGIEDTCVPVEALPEYVRRVQDLMAEHGTQADFYGHASVGVLHIRPILDPKSPDGIATLRALSGRLCELVAEYGGTIAAEHGDGLARSEWIGRMFGPRLLEAFTQVKDAFDPEHLMNPGKIVRAPRMDENLRYGPEYRTAEVDTHFSFVDQGGMHRAVEMCSGVGHCRKKLVGTMCPSYMATLEEQHSTRGRANALRAALSGQWGEGGLTSDELFQVMDLCLACKACKSECPSGVDMAKLKYEFLAHYYGERGYPLRSQLFGRIHTVSRWASKVASLANWAMSTRLNRWALDRFLGIDRRRALPTFAAQTFSRWFARRRHRRPGGRGKVILFNDTFVEYNEPQVGMAATLILERAGYEVELAKNAVCCGRTLISKGFLSQARENARTNVQALAPYVEQGLPIVGLEPSCVAAFKDDYLDLVDDPRARVLATGFHLLEDFLAALARDGRLHLEFTSTRRRILVHGHCQQKALMDPGATVEVLNLPPHFEAAEIPSGCCGMAGSFGYEKEHYDVSLRVGEERLFQAVRAAPPEVEIAAVGTSCRQQIRDVTGRRVRHWAEIMVEAL